SMVKFTAVPLEIDGVNVTEDSFSACLRRHAVWKPVKLTAPIKWISRNTDGNYGTILVQFADVKKGALLRKLLRHFIWYGGFSFMPRQFYVKDKHPRCGKCQRWGHGTHQCWADRPHVVTAVRITMLKITLTLPRAASRWHPDRYARTPPNAPIACKSIRPVGEGAPLPSMLGIRIGSTTNT
ncbi:hypothetical protein BD779DRAFT_1723210, partial [Infundibulicybe gibba]